MAFSSCSSRKRGPYTGLRVTCGAVKGGLELVDRGRDLQTGLQNGLLTLKADVFGPFDETAQVALGLDVLADAEVTGTLLEEGVGHSLHLGLLGGQGSGRDFLALILSLGRTETFS